MTGDGEDLLSGSTEVELRLTGGRLASRRSRLT